MSILVGLLAPVLVALLKIFADTAMASRHGSVSRSGDVGKRMRSRLPQSNYSPGRRANDPARGHTDEL
mgnify:CR=1 FL=1